jgi:alpha-beta hydrolase superfamily lysophospholipase
LKQRLWVVFGLTVIGITGLLWIRSDMGHSRYFRDQTYHHLTLRALNEIPYAGADTGEILETIKHIRAGDSERWFEAWERTANRVAERARASHDPTSRGRALLRAHNYYRTAEFLLAPGDPRRTAAWEKNVRAFYEGLDTLGVHYERIRVPYGTHHLNALYFPGNEGAKTKPLIVACGGFDSTMEELYFVIVAGALERGYSVLVYEGPGQGSVLREQGLTFTPEWERPTGAVLDAFLQSHSRPVRIVLFGMSMGGYLMPRAAAFDTRIDGVIVFDVLFDMAAAARSVSRFSGIVTWLHKNGYHAVANGLLSFGMRTMPGIKWGVNNTMWTMGLSSPGETTVAFDAYTLKDVAANIRGDVLILAGVEDQFVPLKQVTQFQAALTHARSVTTAVFNAESGGKEHCQDGAITLWQATVFDWLLSKYPQVSAGKRDQVATTGKMK